MIYDSWPRRNIKICAIPFTSGRDTVITKRAYVVGGMDCADEVEALKGTVGRLSGVTNLTFNLLAAAIGDWFEAGTVSFLFVGG